MICRILWAYIELIGIGPFFMRTFGKNDKIGGVSGGFILRLKAITGP
jgi:hypothetical protein